MPAIPVEIVSIGGWTLTKDIAIMGFFALVMLAASISMIRGRKNSGSTDINQVSFNVPMIILEGAVVGVLTGIVGAGGGFLIIPALVLFAKLPMKHAVGTSLLIIAAKSLFGFYGDIASGQPIDWPFMLTIAGIAAVGIFVGVWLSTLIDGKKLKSGFGWFVLIMAIYILLKQII